MSNVRWLKSTTRINTGRWTVFIHTCKTPTSTIDTALRTHLRNYRRNSTRQRRRHTTTWQPRPTTQHDDAFRDAGTRRLHQLSQEGNVPDTRGLSAEMVEQSSRGAKKLFVTSSSQARNPPPTPHPDWRDPATKVMCQHHLHQATDPSPVNSSSDGYTPHSTPTNQWTRQVSGPGHPTTDHLYTFQQLGQKAAEWNQTLWVAATDFKEAFDAVEHNSVEGRARALH